MGGLRHGMLAPLSPSIPFRMYPVYSHHMSQFEAILRLFAHSKLLERSIPEPMSGCWLWIGGCDTHGYGSICIGGGHRIGAHRASWMVYNLKPIPDGMLVCHSCDNRACINPAHLFIGTHYDNAMDMVRKGRLVWADSGGKKYGWAYGVN